MKQVRVNRDGTVTGSSLRFSRALAGALVTIPDSPSDLAPAPSASKREWVEYAVRRGADREQAETLTKDELVEKNGVQS